MKGRLYLYIGEESLVDSKVLISTGFDESDFNLEIYTDTNEKLSSVLKDTSFIPNLISDLELSMMVVDDSTDYERLKIFIEDKVGLELLDDCFEVYVSGDWNEIADYLGNNPELSSKKIVLADYLELNQEELQKLKDIFKNQPNLRIRTAGNNSTISIQEFEKTFVAINEIVEKIKKYNYSPFEALMYAYDLVRDRFYVQEDINEDYGVSRDLTSALLGNKIVCLGFANIYNAVVKQLGISSMVFYLLDKNEKNSGHARNLIYIKDDKYNIDGFYFFDPTFDCKHKDNNNFLLSYRFFAKTKNQIDDLSSYDFLYKTYKYWDDDEILELYDSILEGHIDPKTFFSLSGKTGINTMLKMAGLKKLELSPKVSLGDAACLSLKREDCITKEQIISVFEKIYELGNEPINSDAFIKALYTVRRNQYYENPGKYLFDINVLINILINSKIELDSPEDRLLSFLGIRPGMSTSKARNKVEDFILNNSLEGDIDRVKIARLLRTLYQQKVNEESKTKGKML